MARQILPEVHIHPTIREKISHHHRDIVEEIEAAVKEHRVVVVGMAQNPHPRRARRALDRAGVPYQYFQYGSYFSAWRRRTALKMWTGWPTFPMVFVDGALVGGADDLIALIESSALEKMLAEPRA